MIQMINSIQSFDLLVIKFSFGYFETFIFIFLNKIYFFTESIKSNKKIKQIL